jgi:SAM-dependent methyltransferase
LLKAGIPVEKDPLIESIAILESTKNYNSWIYDSIKEFIGRDILEVGCGTGNITDYFIGKGRKITGIEMEKTFFRYASDKYRGNRNIKIVCGDFLKIKKLKSNRYDTVVLLNVLEHIKDDSGAAKKIFASLKRNGRAVILVPAMHFAFGTLDEELGHVKRYEKTDMLELFKKNGFIPEKMFYMNFIGAFAWALNSRVLRRKDFPRNQPVLFDRLFVPFLRPLESFLRPPIGQSLIAVGRKP